MNSTLFSKNAKNDRFGGSLKSHVNSALFSKKAEKELLLHGQSHKKTIDLAAHPALPGRCRLSGTCRAHPNHQPSRAGHQDGIRLAAGDQTPSNYYYYYYDDDYDYDYAYDYDHDYYYYHYHYHHT